MDERLEKALEFSNYRMTIENQKKNLKTRVDTLQTFMYAKGTWKADQPLISFVQSKGCPYVQLHSLFLFSFNS